IGVDLKPTGHIPLEMLHGSTSMPSFLPPVAVLSEAGRTFSMEPVAAQSRSDFAVTQAAGCSDWVLAAVSANAAPGSASSAANAITVFFIVGLRIIPYMYDTTSMYVTLTEPSRAIVRVRPKI